jgi:DNA polymerase elongation subunit (family B)
MLERINLKDILVIDIETVPQYSSYDELSEKWKSFWEKKIQREITEQNTPFELYSKAGIYAEFGKIICICAGFYFENENGLNFKVKAFYGDDEKKLLEEFIEVLNNKYSSESSILCGHNSKEFDFPYIARRCLVNQLQIPFLLDNAGKKPWEVQLLDTMDLWKFGDYKSYTSLDLLAAVFGIDSPKQDIDGSQVWKIYWFDKDLERIKAYCMRDVVTVAQLLLKFKGMQIIKEENIIYIN